MLVTSTLVEDDEASNAPWATLALLPLVAAAAYFHKTRATSGKANLGGIDFETAYNPASRRNSFEAVASAMLAADPVAFELVIDKLATEGLRAESPTSSQWASNAAPLAGTDKAALHGEIPIMLNNDITVGSAGPSNAGAPPVALLMSPGALRTLQSDDGDMKRSRSYGDALNTVSLDEVAPASVLVSLPPALVQMAMVEHRRPDIVASQDGKTLKFKSVKRTNPLYAAEHQNQGALILEDEEELVSELNSSVQDAVEGGRNAHDDHGVAVLTTPSAGTPLFGAQREQQTSPLALGSIAADSTTPVGRAGIARQSSPSFEDSLVFADGSGISEARKRQQSSVVDSNESSVCVESTAVNKAIVARQNTDWSLQAPKELTASPASTGRLNRQGTDWGLLDGSYGGEDLQPAEAFRQGQSVEAANVVGTSVAGTSVYRSSKLSTASMPLAWEAGATPDESPIMTSEKGVHAGRPRLSTTASPAILTPLAASSSKTIWISPTDEAQLLKTDGDTVSFAGRGGSPLGSTSEIAGHGPPLLHAQRAGSPLGKGSTVHAVEEMAAIPLANAARAGQAESGVQIAGVSAGASRPDQSYLEHNNAANRAVTSSDAVDVSTAGRGRNRNARTMSLFGVSSSGTDADTATARTLSLSGISTDATDDDAALVRAAQYGTSALSAADDVFTGVGESAGALAFVATEESNDGTDAATAEDVDEFMAWFAAREAQFLLDDDAATEAAARDLDQGGLEASAIREGNAADAAKRVVVVTPDGKPGGSTAGSTAALFRAHVASNGTQFESMPMDKVVDSDLFRAWLSSRYEGMGAVGGDEVDAVYSAHQAQQASDAAEEEAGGTIDEAELDAVYNAHREGTTFDGSASRRSSGVSASSGVLHPDLHSAAGESNVELSAELPTAFFGMREAMISDFAERGTHDAGAVAGTSESARGRLGEEEARPTASALFVAEKGTQPDTPWSPTGSAAAGAAAVARGAGTAHTTPRKSAAKVVAL